MGRGWCGGVLAVVALFGMELVVPACGLAAFSRPSLRTLPGLTGLEGGVAIDPEVEAPAVPGAAEGDVWVASEGVLDEFSPAYEAVEPNHPIPHESKPPFVPGAFSLAIERGTGDFYRAGKGHYVALDDSPPGSLEDPSACGTAPLALDECFVYVASWGESHGVEKLSSGGKAEPFGASEAYIGGVDNNLITGTPETPTGGFGGQGLTGVAVDGRGDIFADNSSRSAVYEYLASGQFVRSFSLESVEVPRVGPGLGPGQIEGVAVDPLSRHLLVATAAPLPRKGFEGVVDEFEVEGPETGRFVNQVREAQPGVPLEEPVGLAVDSKGDVYVVDKEADVVDVFGPGHYLPGLRLGEAAERTPGSVVLSGSVNPDAVVNKAPVSECYFEIVDAAEYEASVGEGKGGFSSAGVKRTECSPDAAGLLVNEQPQPVKADVGGLEAGVSYYYRLAAASGGEDGGLAATSASAFTTPAPARIISSTAGEVSSGFAQLRAQIQPLGTAVNYFFEYGPTTAYGMDAPVLSEREPYGALLGSGGPTGGAVESVVQDIGGLAAGTAYHFRVVAVSEGREEGRVTFKQTFSYGPDETFSTLPAPATGLADDRAYELVTPAVKEGGSDMFAEAPTNGGFTNSYDDGVPAPSGEAFFLESRSAFGSFPFSVDQAYVLQREYAKGGWSYTSLAAERLGVQSFVDAVFDPLEPSRVLFDDGVGALAGDEGEARTNLVGPAGAPTVCEGPVAVGTAVTEDCYVQLHADAPISSSDTVGAETFIAGASQDLGRVVLQSARKAGEEELCSGAGGVTHGEVLCEWDGGYETVDGQARPKLMLVNVSPESEGETPQPVSKCGAAIGDAIEKANEDGVAYRAVSSDGSRVFFEAPDPLAGDEEAKEGCWDRYAEEHEGRAPVNAPQLYARVAGGSGEERTLEVSAPEEGVSVPSSQRFPAWYAGASEDGSRVFFATRTWVMGAHPPTHDLELYECQITETEGQPGCRLSWVSAGEPGAAGYQQGANVQHVPAVAADGAAVYYEAGGALTTTVAHGGVYRYDTETGTTSYIAPYGQWEPSRGGNGACPPEQMLCSIANWYATPNGQFLLFLGPDGLERYDAAEPTSAGNPVCVSCAGEGAGGGQGAEFARSAMESVSAGPTPALSENGEYAFFDTPEKLVAGAANQAGEHPTLDVYEWQEDPETSQDTISLVGSGSDPSPTYFLGYSPYRLPDGTIVEGGNVFIGTHAELSPQDTNGLGNVYDARICEPESPCIGPPERETAQCEGSACQTPPTPPSDATPASLTFSGPGNPAPSKVSSGVPALTNAQKLAAALRVCRKESGKKRRSVCEARARKRYAPAKKAKRPASGSRRKAGSRSEKAGGR